MASPVDLLLITHNRPHYVKEMTKCLFNDSDDFHIFWWDNASGDETRDWIESVNDPRIVLKHYCRENRYQLEPTQWFLDHCRSDVAGKIDDDVLLTEGWTKHFSNILRTQAQSGLLACWIFMPDDYHSSRAQRREVKLGPHRIMRNVMVQGQSCLARTSVLRKYFDCRLKGFPVNQLQMVSDGLVNGFPAPLFYGHNMDDPRSPYYRPLIGPNGPYPGGLTANIFALNSARHYADWIIADAWERQYLPFPMQRILFNIDEMEGLCGRLLRRIQSRIVPSRRIIRLAHSAHERNKLYV